MYFRLAIWIKDVESEQLKVINNPKTEQIFVRFFGPYQLTDKRPEGKLPFKVEMQESKDMKVAKAWNKLISM